MGDESEENRKEDISTRLEKDALNKSEDTSAKENQKHDLHGTHATRTHATSKKSEPRTHKKTDREDGGRPGRKDSDTDSDDSITESNDSDPADDEEPGQKKVDKQQSNINENSDTIRLRERKKHKVIYRPESIKDDIISESKKTDISSILLIVVVVTIIMIFVAVNKYNGIIAAFDQSAEHTFRRVDEFKEKLDAMKKEFPSQYDVMWNMLRNSGGRHLSKVFNDDKEVLTPMSYLFAGYAESSETLTCFVSKLAAVFTKLNETKSSERALYSKDYSGKGDKGKLDEVIKSKLNGTEKLLIVANIDKLHFDVAQLFMSYADEHNDVASYPQSILLLTTELPFPFNAKSTRRWDEEDVVEYFMSTVWHDIHPDRSSPLWTRVGDGLSLIKKEENNPCNV